MSLSVPALFAAALEANPAGRVEVGGHGPLVICDLDRRSRDTPAHADEWLWRGARDLGLKAVRLRCCRVADRAQGRYGVSAPRPAEARRATTV